MSELLVVDGDEYRWLFDLMLRIEMAEDIGTDDDRDRIAGLFQRHACCESCERRWNDMTLEKAGYKKKGGV